MPSVLYEREVPLAFDPFCQGLVRALDRLVVQSQANQVTMCIGGSPAPGEICVPVAVTVTAPSAGDASIGIAIDPRAGSILFPHFTGTFQALPLSRTRTALRLEGEYRVPLGAIGSIVNTAGLHRLADANLRSFFEQVAEASITPAREPSKRS